MKCNLVKVSHNEFHQIYRRVYVKPGEFSLWPHANQNLLSINMSGNRITHQRLLTLSHIKSQQNLSTGL
jgi:hypothetical protein